LKKIIDNYLNDTTKAFDNLIQSSCDKEISLAAKVIVKAFKNKKKLLICGNGGSASDSQHFAAELIGRFKKDRKSFPAISLNTDTSAITAIANDYNYKNIFSRQIEGIGNKGDILFAISTSGNSENVVYASSIAKKKGLKVIGLTGFSKSKLDRNCDICIKVPENETSHIQELHIVVIHMLCIIIEHEIID